MIRYKTVTFHLNNFLIVIISKANLPCLLTLKSRTSCFSYNENETPQKLIFWGFNIKSNYGLTASVWDRHTCKFFYLQFSSVLVRWNEIFIHYFSLVCEGAPFKVICQQRLIQSQPTFCSIKPSLNSCIHVMIRKWFIVFLTHQLIDKTCNNFTMPTCWNEN